MIIHQAIKYLYNRYGSEILLRKRLYNLLRDYHIFDYEEPSLQYTFEIVIHRYGEEMYTSLHTQEWMSMYNRVLMDCKRKFGFKEDIIDYIFESIAYGCAQIPALSKNYITTTNNRTERWLTHILFYQLCGFNILPIQGDQENWYKNYKSFKNPAYGSWGDFKGDQINIDLARKIAISQEYTGFGGILGVNNLRVLDFDELGLFTKVVNGPWHEQYEAFNDFVKYCLLLLGLPEDYQWVVRTGGGCGFHIIFKTNDILNYTPEVISFKSRKELSKEKLDVKALDLIWNGYIVLPPSYGARVFDHDLWEIEPFFYRFHNNDLFPNYEPQFVSIDSLNNFLNEYCAEDHYYGGWLDGSTLYGHKKRSSEFGSYSNDYLSHNDSMEWLEQCDSPEGLNMLAIQYIKQKEYGQAARVLSQVLNFSFAAYNYAVLMSYGYVHYSSLLLKRLRQTYENDSRISKYDIENLSDRLSKLNKH